MSLFFYLVDLFFRLKFFCFGYVCYLYIQQPSLVVIKTYMIIIQTVF